MWDTLVRRWFTYRYERGSKMRLKYELYIAASGESKELYKRTLPKLDFFNCDALTLSELVSKIPNESIKIDALESKIIFKESIKRVMQELKHFKFSKENMFEDTITMLFDFYTKIKNNSVVLEEFVEGDKKDDIKLIFGTFEAIKTEKNLEDETDILNSVDTDSLTTFLEKYDSILIDSQFRETQISFLYSDREEELFTFIENGGRVVYEENTSKEFTKNITLNKAFDFSDEAREAVKIAKDLLINKKVPIEDIVIVSSYIDEYKNDLERYTKEYNIHSLISKGKDFSQTPTYHEMLKLKDEKEFKLYAEEASERVKSLDKEFQYEYKQIVNLGLRLAKQALYLVQKMTNYSIKVKFRDIFENLASTTTYHNSTKVNSLFITEHNQLLKKCYKHIIYLGTDSTHLPQKFNDNFLYDSLSAPKLHISNYYKDAIYIYDMLKKNSENLYIVTALYDGKRELQISSIINDNYTSKLDSFEVSQNIQSLDDMLDDSKQTPIDKKSVEFIESKQVKPSDKYHGNIGKEYQEDDNYKTIYSASRLNLFTECPMKYYFNYILKASSPSEFNDEEFDSAEAGTLFHSVAEIFANEYKKDSTIDVDTKVQEIYNEEYKKALPKRDDEIHETVFHKQKKQELQIAIDRFKEYVKEDGLENFHSAEESFNFSMDGNDFTGVIDRIDINEANNTISLIDYKTSKADKHTGSKDKKYEKLLAHEEFQLPLYHFFIEQDENYMQYKEGESYLITFTGDTKKETNKRFGQTSSTTSDNKNKIYHFNENEKQKYKEAIITIVTKITNGEFNPTPSEDACQWCSYKSICGDGVVVEKKF